MTKVQEWLPQAAVIDAALDARVTAAVMRWSARWFAASGFALGHAKLLPDANGLAALVSEARGVELRIESERLDGLARLLLDVPKDLAMDDTARQVVRSIAIKAVHELVADLAADLQFPPQAPASPDDAIVSFPLRGAGGGATIAHLTLRWANLVRGRKARIGSPGPVRSDSVLDALAHEEIRFDAILGNVTLSVREFQTLGTGDVLLFDTDPTRDVRLRLTKSGGSLARARLQTNADQLALLAA
ncbi:MAG: FliM/FliN family flagellar motor switch protein [Proteobacteria bacterium]|nr:FliM/FliN family flagellar motor switch protein [Pseudomonadota bacterium]